MIEVYVVVPARTVIYGASTSFQGAAEKLRADDTCEVVCVQVTEDGD